MITFLSPLILSQFICASLMGLDKGGIPGLAPIGISFALSIGSDLDSQRTLALFVPCLFFADLGACYVYKESVNMEISKVFLVPMLVGIFIGFLVLNMIDGKQIKLCVGFSLLLVIFIQIYSLYLKSKFVEKDQPLPTKISVIQDSNSNKKIKSSKDYYLLIFSAVICGILSTIANIAGPIATAYFLTIKLDKRELNGSRAWLFMIANAFKILGQFYLKNITFSDFEILVYLIFISVLFTFVAERYIIKYLDQDAFEFISWALILFSSIKMLLEGMSYSII